MTQASHVTLGVMGLSEAALQLLVSLLLLLPPTTPYSSNCPCYRPPNGTAVLEEQLFSTATETRELNCCAHHLLAAHDPQYSDSDSFSLVWSFKGAEYKEVDGKEEKWPRDVSTFRLSPCGLQTLESEAVRFIDEGVYSCHVTSSTGFSINKTFSLCLDYYKLTPPTNSSISKDTSALLRQTATFKCVVFVGRPVCEKTQDYSLVWTKERPDGSWVNASELPNIKITTSGVENEMMKSTITVRSIETEHFGRYRCNVTNHFGSLPLDVSLSKGVPPVIRVTGEYRAALVIMVAATVFLAVTVVFWRRCQVAFSLHFRQKKTGLSTDSSPVGPLQVTKPATGGCPGCVMSQPLLPL